jgi:hypothetical protein
MGVDEPERFVFLCQIAQQLHFDEVFQHIGVIAGMKRVSVTQHGFASGIVRDAIMTHCTVQQNI